MKNMKHISDRGLELSTSTRGRELKNCRPVIAGKENRSTSTRGRELKIYEYKWYVIVKSSTSTRGRELKMALIAFLTAV